MIVRLLISLVLFVAVVNLFSCTRKDASRKGHSIHDSDKNDTSEKGIISLTQTEEQHANIQVDTVRVKLISAYSTLLGTVSLDERRVSVVTSRMNGRIDKLFVRDPQQMITEGEPLYAIYSEELLSYENEYLNAIQTHQQFDSANPVSKKLVEATKQKLLAFGLSKQQLTALETSRNTSPLITFTSPASGTLIELSVSEGQYVQTGDPLLKVVDISELWIEAQMYPDEIKWLYEKPTITVEFDSYPGELFQASPVFDNPGFEPDQKISLVRFAITINKYPIKPGMMAYVHIQRNEKRGLVIPKSAILIGDMITAWVRSAEGKYENRMVQLGIQNKNEVEVISGLREGELIVTKGNYLLNCALVLKKGVGGHEMDGM